MFDGFTSMTKHFTTKNTLSELTTAANPNKISQKLLIQSWGVSIRNYEKWDSLLLTLSKNDDPKAPVSDNFKNLKN